MTEKKEQDLVDDVQGEWLSSLWIRFLNTKRSQKASLGIGLSAILLIAVGAFVGPDIISPYIVPVIGLFMFLWGLFSELEKCEVKKAA